MNVCPPRPWRIVAVYNKRTRIVDAEDKWVADTRSEAAAEMLVACVNAMSEPRLAYTPGGAGV